MLKIIEAEVMISEEGFTQPSGAFQRTHRVCIKRWRSSWYLSLSILEGELRRKVKDRREGQDEERTGRKEKQIGISFSWPACPSPDACAYCCLL